MWRDGGLSCAENMLSQGHDALIITLDLKKFYYRVGITEDIFNKIIIDEDNKSDINIHSAVFSIIKRYTQVLHENYIEHNGNVLPIGFLPSAVLSNWCLSEFDKGILDFWNPSYYGRYVDDIIIVEKMEKGSEIYTRARDNNLSKDYVIDYFLGNGRRNTAYCFAEKSAVLKKSPIDVAITNGKPIHNGEAKSDYLYRINTAFCLSDQSLFEFEPDKIRIMALFSDNNSTALINKFKKELYENVSEFRLMPEVGEAFSQEDFSRFYRLENDATINKLRGIKEIVMDKYELSKFLGKYRVVSNLVDDGNTKKFTRIIGQMFNDRELIENYILWERVFEIFITDKDYIGFVKFAKRVKTAINILEMENNRIRIETVKSSLQKHLSATLNRVLSLIWGEKAEKIINDIYDALIKITLRGAYIDTCMSNKYIMPIPAEIISNPSDKNDVNFTEFTESFKRLHDNITIYKSEYDFLPYFRQAQDIAISMFLKNICNGHKENYKMINVDYVNMIHYEISNVPIHFEELPPVVLKVGDKTNNKLKVAIANVNVSGVWNLENALKGRKLNRKYARYRTLAELVNEAIIEKADMLVLPENYVPFEWLAALATKAALEGLAIITGVEHLIFDNKVYNYTAVILPFKYFNTIPTSAIFFQLKKHYAPEEKRVIKGYGFSVIEETEKRPIYRWNDCYFPVYCCYELTNINERANFMSWADMIVAVEHNKDINYFGNIIESLSRDLHCYCVQVNTSEYGDSRITQPKRTVEQNLITVKGGINPALLIDEIDIQALREFQIKDYALQKNGIFKPTPPGIKKEIVRWKIDNKNE